MPTTTDLLTAALTGGTLSALLEFVRFWLTRRDRNRRQHWEKALDERAQIHQRLNNLVSRTPADRAMVLVLHNGGNTPTCGNMWSSIVAENVSDRLPQRQEGWQHVPLDPALMQHMRRALVEDSVDIDVSQLSGPAGNFLASQNIPYAELRFLCYTRSASYFLCMNFLQSQQTLELRADYHDLLRQETHTLGQLIQSSYIRARVR